MERRVKEENAETSAIHMKSLSHSPIPTRATCMHVYACACDRWGKEERSLPIGTPPARCACLATGNSRHCRQSLFCGSEENQKVSSIARPRNCGIVSHTVCVYGTLFFSRSFLSPMIGELSNRMTCTSALAHSISVGGGYFGSMGFKSRKVCATWPSKECMG